MEHPGVSTVIAFIAEALEIVGVMVVALAFAHAIIRALWHFGHKRDNAYELLRPYLGRALLLGLEFLVAADIIQTVTIEATRDAILSLGLLIVIRIVLGWSISVEIEGCWPWEVAKKQAAKERSGTKTSKE